MKYKNYNDYELIYMVKENDDFSYDALYKKYMPIIKSIAYDFYIKYKSKRKLRFSSLMLTSVCLSPAWADKRPIAGYPKGCLLEAWGEISPGSEGRRLSVSAQLLNSNIDCARRSLYDNAFGQEFDSPHLHHQLRRKCKLRL